MKQLFPNRYLIWSLVACFFFSPLGVIPVILSIVAIIETKSESPDEDRIGKLKKWIIATVTITFVTIIGISTKILLSILPEL